MHVYTYTHAHTLDTHYHTCTHMSTHIHIHTVIWKGVWLLVYACIYSWLDNNCFITKVMSDNKNYVQKYSVWRMADGNPSSRSDANLKDKFRSIEFQSFS